MLFKVLNITRVLIKLEIFREKRARKGTLEKKAKKEDRHRASVFCRSDNHIFNF